VNFTDLHEHALGAINEVLAERSRQAREAIYQSLAAEFENHAHAADPDRVQPYLARLRRGVNSLTVSTNADGHLVLTSSDSQVFAQYDMGTLWFANRAGALARAVSEPLRDRRT